MRFASERTAGQFRIAKRVYIAVDDDAERARHRIGAALNAVYGRDVGPVAVFGPPGTCVEGLREVARAGAEMILLNPLFDEVEQMERLAAEVVPRVG